MCRNDGSAAGTAGKSKVLHTPFKGRGNDMVSGLYCGEAYIGTFRKAIIITDLGTQDSQSWIIQFGRIVHRYHAVGDTGISQFNIVYGVFLVIDSDLLVGLHQRGIIETDPVFPRGDPFPVYDSRSGLNTLFFTGKPVFIGVTANASCTVPTHFTDRSVRIIKQHFKISTLIRGNEDHKAVCANRHFSGTQMFCQ